MIIIILWQKTFLDSQCHDWHWIYHHPASELSSYVEVNAVATTCVCLFDQNTIRCINNNHDNKIDDHVGVMCMIPTAMNLFFSVGVPKKT